MFQPNQMTAGKDRHPRPWRGQVGIKGLAWLQRLAKTPKAEGSWRLPVPPMSE